MAHGLNLSKFEDYEVDEFGNPINKMGQPLIQSNAIVPTEANPFINRGRSATSINNNGYVPLVINKETALPGTTTTTRRGLDFDFTTEMPELSISPAISLPTTINPSIPTQPMATVTDKEFVERVLSPKKKSSFTNWWNELGSDRKQALTRGVLATGLNMMSLGGRTYDRPVSALGIIGEAGKAGLNQYEDTYSRERIFNLQKENADMARKIKEMNITRFKASEPFLAESARREHEIQGLQLEQLKKPKPMVLPGNQYGFVRVNKDGTITELQKPIDKETMNKEYGYNRDEIANIVKLFRPEQTDIIETLLATKDPAQMSNILEAKKPIIEDIEKQLSRPEYAAYKARWDAARENIDRIMGFKQPIGLNLETTANDFKSTFETRPSLDAIFK